MSTPNWHRIRVGLVALGGMVSALEVAAQPMPVEPTLYELAGRNLSISYSTTSLEGEPRLTLVRGDRRPRHFTGEQILVEETLIGQLITVVLRQIPDLNTISLSLLLPDINLEAGGAALFETHVTYTTHHTTIAGEAGVVGPIQTYFTKPVFGQASDVDFLGDSLAGVFGKVIQSPTCPGPQRVDQKCVGPLPDVEVQLLDGTDSPAAAAVTDARGLFALRAEPGEYTVRVAIDGALPACPERPVRVGEQFVRLTIHCDTGIR